VNKKSILTTMLLCVRKMAEQIFQWLKYNSECLSTNWSRPSVVSRRSGWRGPS